MWGERSNHNRIIGSLEKELLEYSEADIDYVL
jgi:hypothetical protein